MSLIPCTSNCIYQKDGYCNLERVSSPAKSTAEGACVYYVESRKPKKSKSGGL